MDENKALKAAYDLMVQMEKNHPAKGFQAQDIAELTRILSHFGNHKIVLIPHHLSIDMSLRHFLNFMVPIERLLAKNLSDEQFLITSTDRKSLHPKSKLYFVLENLRSSFNVGSIFRLADCLNIEHIYLVGYTPTPENDGVKKTSMGTADHVPWTHFDKLETVLRELRKKNIPLLALETAEKSVSLHQAQIGMPAALLVGNERFGLETTALSVCETVISIPTFGAKNSLNVASALSIAAYEWKRQNP